MQLISHTIKLQLSVTKKISKCLYSCWPNHSQRIGVSSISAPLPRCRNRREGKYTSRAAISKQVRIAGVMLAQLHTVTESFCFRVEREQKQAQRSRLHSCLHNSPFTMATGESSQLFTCSISLPQTLPTVFAVRALQCYVKRATLELNRVQPMWMRCFRKCCSE